jgi:hypothetical protein
MDGWSEDDVQTFERLMTRFADGVAALTDSTAGPAWADKGWAAVAPRMTDKNMESTR